MIKTKIRIMMMIINGNKILPRRPGFDPRSSDEGFMVDTVGLGQVSPSTSDSPSNSHYTSCFTFVNHPIVQCSIGSILTVSLSNELKTFVLHAFRRFFK